MREKDQRVLQLLGWRQGQGVAYKTVARRVWGNAYVPRQLILAAVGRLVAAGHDVRKLHGWGLVYFRPPGGVQP